MNRRDLLKKTGLLAFASAVTAPTAWAAGNKKRRLALTVAHITDVHVRPEESVPDRYKKCLDDVKKHKVDFLLNGGDSIHAADYADIKRERVTEQWRAWDECMKSVQSLKVYSCIGNHDPWWAAPDKDDGMYGKNYVVQRLQIPHRYYSFSNNGWHFIVLDGNNKNISLDEEQYAWLVDDLEKLPANTPTLLMSHFPVFGATPVLVKGNHSDYQKLKDVFYKHRDKVKVVLSGHNHLYDKTLYNGVWYCCNGAMSGFWWGKGNSESAGPYYYLETPPGYAILKLYTDGFVENEYYVHGR
jgi:3',5'-cyclic AMP phosphodiesterase CpdA